MLRSTLRKLSRTLTSTTRRPARSMVRRTALQVEGLEDRLVMSSTTLQSFVTTELNALQTSIDQQLFSKTLPLVGPALNQVGNSIVGSFENALIKGANDAQAAVSHGAQAIKTALKKDLGSILQGIDTTTGSHGDFTATLHLHDSSVLNTPTVDLNLGLPGLPIQFATHNAAVSVQAGYDIELEFGLQGGSPFLKTKADPKNTSNPLGVALGIGASVAPGSSISASLGGLTAILTQPKQLPVANVARQPGGGGGAPNPIAPPTNFNANLDFGFSVSSSGGIQLATPQLTGAANINLQAALNLGDNPSLPSITAGLTGSWSFNSADPTQNGPLGNAPTVSFTHVTVDLGSFLSNVVRPVLTSVQQFTEPLSVVTTALTTPLPGITSVTNLLGMQPVTLASLLGGQSGGLQTFANTINFINGLQLPTSGSVKVDVGSFNIADARQTNSPATNFVESAAVQQHGLLGTAGGQSQSTYSSLQTQADFDFPILDNPVSFLSSVLMGQQVNLVKATLGVNINPSFNQHIPFIGIPEIASIDVDFGGSLNLDLGATFVLTDGFLLGGHLLDSLQVQNAHMDAGLTVSAGLSVGLGGIIGASLDGTVGVNFDLGLSKKSTGSTTFTGTDLLDGNVALNFTQAQLQAGIQFNSWSPIGGLSFSDTLFTENLINGSTTDSGSGGGGSGGSGLGGPIGGGGGGHQLQ